MGIEKKFRRHYKKIITLCGYLLLTFSAGAETIYEFVFPHKPKGTKITTEALPKSVVLRLEKKKIKSAILTDFILSVEIIIIALGTVVNETIGVQIGVVSVIATIATVGVYGLVALIIRMDDLGFKPFDIIENHYFRGFNIQLDIIFINKNFNLSFNELKKWLIKINNEFR